MHASILYLLRVHTVWGTWTELLRKNLRFFFEMLAKQTDILIERLLVRYRFNTVTGYLRTLQPVINS